MAEVEGAFPTLLLEEQLPNLLKPALKPAPEIQPSGNAVIFPRPRQRKMSNATTHLIAHH